MDKKLDLTTLSQRMKKLPEAEIAKVKGMYDLCDGKCKPECDILTTMDIMRSTHYREECPCGSIWVAFGLGWGP